ADLVDARLRLDHRLGRVVRPAVDHLAQDLARGRVPAGFVGDAELALVVGAQVLAEREALGGRVLLALERRSVLPARDERAAAGRVVAGVAGGGHRVDAGLATLPVRGHALQPRALGVVGDLEARLRQAVDVGVHGLHGAALYGGLGVVSARGERQRAGPGHRGG